MSVGTSNTGATGKIGSLASLVYGPFVLPTAIRGIVEDSRQFEGNGVLNHLDKITYLSSRLAMLATVAGVEAFGVNEIANNGQPGVWAVPAFTNTCSLAYEGLKAVGIYSERITSRMFGNRENETGANLPNKDGIMDYARPYYPYDDEYH